eukprot:COSAG01_NODE_46885_length_395_cov_29.672297_1_plen_64_part_10
MRAHLCVAALIASASVLESVEAGYHLSNETYNLGNETYNLGNTTQKITGMCTGNTNSAEDVVCP